MLATQVEGTGTTDPQIIVGLRNDGRATARAPFLAIRCDGGFHRSEFGLDGNRNEGMPLLSRFVIPEYPWSYGGGTEIAVH